MHLSLFHFHHSKARRDIDMLNGPIVSGICRFAIPLVLTNLLQLLFNTADIIIIGRFGNANALASVGLASITAVTYANILIHFSGGSTVAAGIALGAQDHDRVRKTVHSAIGLGLLTGVVLMLIMLATMKSLLASLNTPDGIFADSFRYLCFYLPSLPAISIYNYGAGLLRAKGDTQRPFFILAFSGVINVLLNLLFVLVFKLGVVGVALATTISFYISMTSILYLLCHETGAFRLSLRNVTLRSPTVPMMLRIGATNALQGLLFHAANLAVQGAVNSFGPAVIAGNAAAANIGAYLWTIMNGFGHAGMSFAAQCTGARRFRRIRDIRFRLILLVLALGIGGSIAFVTFARPLLSLYTQSSDAIEAGLHRIRLVCGFYFICGLMDSFSLLIRGMGYAMVPAMISLAGAFGLRLCWIFTLFRLPQFHTLFWLYMTYPVSWSVTMVTLYSVLSLLLRKKIREASEKPRPASSPQEAPPVQS